MIWLPSGKPEQCLSPKEEYHREYVLATVVFKKINLIQVAMVLFLLHFTYQSLTDSAASEPIYSRISCLCVSESA